MDKLQVDVFISGGGLAGLVAAAAFSQAGYQVLLVDPTPRQSANNAKPPDLRSTAYLQPARALLEDIGLWTDMAPFAMPLKSLRIVDCAGDPPVIRDERAFRSDINGEPLGWNFLNSTARQIILDFLDKQPNVDMRFGLGFAGVLTRTSSAIVTLSDGTNVTAKLVIGADGRHSPVRQAANISVHTTRYGQKSLAFTATHIEPHNYVSTEIYHHGGPFTMVPLADICGTPASAIVWMNAGPRALELSNLDKTTFNSEMTRRSAALFGPMELAGDCAIWPILTQVANRLVGQRVAIIAEAAHVLPPIGAQGLNTSLNDIAALVACARAYPHDLGGRDMLVEYERARLPDIKKRAKAIDVFNRVTRSNAPGAQTLRLLGLKAAHDIAPIRQHLMRAGMGPD